MNIPVDSFNGKVFDDHKMIWRALDEVPAIRREHFLDDHHHLISPWAYSATEITRRSIAKTIA